MPAQPLYDATSGVRRALRSSPSSRCRRWLPARRTSQRPATSRSSCW